MSRWSYYHLRSAAAVPCRATVIIIIYGLLPPFRATPPSPLSAFYRRRSVPRSRLNCYHRAAAAVVLRRQSFIITGLPPPLCRAAEYSCYWFAAATLLRQELFSRIFRHAVAVAWSNAASWALPVIPVLPTLPPLLDNCNPWCLVMLIGQII